MSITEKFKVGDRIKYTYHPGESESGWFIADIAEIRDSGYVANLVDKGEGTPYQSNTFNGIHIGDDTNKSIKLGRIVNRLVGPAPVVEGPIVQTPLGTPDGDEEIMDATGKVVLRVRSTSFDLFSDAVAFAEFVRDAVNEKVQREQEGA